ncbi:MAG: ATP synthase subunit I [Planctomycetota bacterium]|nr:ATP synthase subunit I [Planctomycetota bacterium]
MDGQLMKYGLMIVIGMIFGAIFFGGLWLTVRQMTTSKSPGLLFFVSVVVRTLIVLGGFWYFAAGDAVSIGACLLGFFGLRLLATHGGAIFGAAFGKRARH